MFVIKLLQVEELVDTWSVCHCNDHRICSDYPDRPSSPYYAGELIVSQLISIIYHLII